MLDQRSTNGIFFISILQRLTEAGKKSWFIPLLFFILNLVIKSFSITRYSYDLDESWHTYFSQWNLKELLRQASDDPNGPFYNLLLHYWMKIFGNSEVATRMLSVIFSALTAPVIYLLMNKHFSKQAAIFSALIFSVSDFHFFYSHIARVYALINFLAVLSIYFYLEHIKTGGLRNWILYTVVNVLMLYTHLTTIFLLAAQLAAGVLFFGESKKNVLKTIAGMAVPVLLFIPWVLNSPYFNRPKPASWMHVPSWQDVKDLLIDFADTEKFLYLFIVLIILGAVLLYNKPRYLRTGFLFLLFCFLIPVICNAIVSYKLVPIFMSRYVMASSLSFYMLAGISISLFPVNRIFKWLFVAGLISIYAFSLGTKRFTYEDWRTVVNDVKKKKTNRTLIAISPTYQKYSFAYYYNRDYFNKPDSMIALLRKEKVILAETEMPLKELPDDYDKVIVLTSHEAVISPKRLIKYLKINYGTSCDIPYSGIHMYCFETRVPVAFFADSMEAEVPRFQLRKVIEAEFAHSGKKVCMLDKSSPFSNTVEYKMAASSPLARYLKACGWVYLGKDDINCGLVMSIENDKQFLIYQSYDVKKFGSPGAGKWFQVCDEIKIPDKVLPTDRFKTYFWNQGNSPVYVDDMEVIEESK